jgi:hypothetical protein
LRCRRELADDQHGLRLRLKFDLGDPEAEYLANMPWEWLCDPETGEFLAQDVRFPVVRAFETRQQASPLKVNPPLRILVVDASPRAMKRLKLRVEINRMREALAPLIKKKQIQIFRLTRVSPQALLNALRDKSIHILHFMGHGGYSPEYGLGAVFFVTADRRKDQVDGEMFASAVKGSSQLRLVVLNSCKSARYRGRAEASSYAGVASAILDRTDVPAVIANQYSISDRAAIAFSEAFYRRLAGGAPVDAAVSDARLQLGWRGREWATPILFLGAPDGQIFNLKPGADVPEVCDISRRDKTPVRLGVRSFIGWGADMPERTDAMLELKRFFRGPEGRYIRDPEMWQAKIFPKLRRFLLDHLDEQRPLLLDFAAHSSLAFAAGWVLEDKSGLDVRVRQRTKDKGEIEWGPNQGKVPEGSLWQKRRDLKVAAGQPDIAVALSITHRDLAKEVRAFIKEQGLPVGRIVDATIAPETGPKSVRGGRHALRLAQVLAPRLRVRHQSERGGRLHVFCAGPNAFMFYLGQLSRTLGRIVLYEYPFGSGRYADYRKSIELPPPDEV